jgi:hypothetical protein
VKTFERKQATAPTVARLNLCGEDEMKRTVIFCSALAITFAVATAFPATANASNDATPHRTHVVVAHVHAIPSSAVALSPSILGPAIRRDDDSDGLSRNTDECNRGCIDN